MWKQEEQGKFDATVWNGRIDVTAAVFRVAMLLCLGLFWLGLIVWIFS